jgi:hypothetical protein
MTSKAIDLLLPRKPEPGLGIIERAGYRKIAINFPEDLFFKIRDQAIRENKTISEVVTMLCQVGYLDLCESDALEPALAPRT